ncbi:MAG: 3-hydroxyacyl-CoA dehydrogenase NAD-binding domain-containing protein [Verrucomicrobiia bacterium]
MNMIDVQSDRDGVAWVIFNNWRQKYNLLNPPEVRQLESIVNNLTARPPRGVVFISAKKDMFLGGLDPAELPKLGDPKTAEEFSLTGQRLFDQVAALPVPTVAAIDGRCTCGGLEFALACRYRVATDSPHTVLSLTDVRVGAIPAWGATYRLPKLIGVWQALQMIILAGAILPSAARRMGLVDAVVKASELRELARSLATGESQLRQQEAPAWKRIWPMRTLAYRLARWIAQVNPGSSDTVAQPAYLRLLPLVVQQMGNLPVRTQLAAIKAIETVLATRKTEDRRRITARLFAEAVTSEECKNLPRMLHLRSTDRYTKLLGFGPSGRPRTPLKAVPEVGVIAAGAAGARLAQWCSRHGIIVRLYSPKTEEQPGLMRRIELLYTEQLKGLKLSETELQDGLDRLQSIDDAKGFDKCKIIIEAARTPTEAWPPMAHELDGALRRGCILAVHVVATPIEPWALATSRPKQVVGIQLFDPVQERELVELVRGADTSPETLAIAAAFVAQIKKYPVVAKSAPGFLVNRLLTTYLNEAVLMVGEGVGIEAIDEAMLDFGWSLGPLRLIDEMGIDAIVDVSSQLATAFRDRMIVMPMLQQMYQSGLQGRKGAAGFYTYGGKRLRANRQLRLTRGKSMDSGAIQKRLMGVMIAEAKRCLDEHIVATEDDIDVAVLFGIGFPQSRGGLVTYARYSGLWA